MKKNTNVEKQIAYGSVLSFLSIGINIVAGLLYTPWMISQIGTSDYGLYTLAISLISIFLFDFGLSSATARFVSNYRAEGKFKEIESFLGCIYKLYLLVCLAICIVLVIVFFFIEQIYNSLQVGEIERFKVVYIVAASYNVVSFPFITLNGILTSFEKFIQLKLTDIIYRIMIVSLTVLGLVKGMGLYYLVTIYAIVGIIVIIIKIIIVTKQLEIKIDFSNKMSIKYNEIFCFSIWVTIVSITQRLVFNITPSILGAVTSSHAIAVFGIIMTIEGYMYTITAVISNFFMPKISRIYVAEKANESINALLISVGKFQFLLNGILIAGFICVGKQFISIWMGNGFEDAYVGIILVTIPGLFFNSLEIANTAVVVNNKIKITAFVNIIVGVTCVCLSLYFSYLYGVMGACVAICIAYVIRVILLLIIYHKYLMINTISFIKKCYLREFPVIVLSIIIFEIINTFIGPGQWLNLIIKVGIIICLYVMLVCLIGLNRTERVLILDTVKRVIGK